MQRDAQGSPQYLTAYGPIDPNKRTLIVGCGGGYDIFCGLPLYFALTEAVRGAVSDERSQPIPPVMANFSFTNEALLGKGQMPLGPESGLWRISAKELPLPTKEEFLDEIIEGETPPDWLLQQMGLTLNEYRESHAGLRKDGVDGKYYFPEWSLSRELAQPVWCFNGTRGGMGIVEALQYLICEYDIEHIVVVDGGTDSLMKGDEEHLGTQFEDMLTIASVIEAARSAGHNIDLDLYILGWNIDIVHGVTDASVNANILDAIQGGGFRGAYHLLNDPLSATKYQETFLACQPSGSWINSLVTGSLKGMPPGTTPEWILQSRGPSRVPISPMMGLYWAFSLDWIASRKTWDLASIAASKTEAEAEGLLECSTQV